MYFKKYKYLITVILFFLIGFFYLYNDNKNLEIDDIEINEVIKKVIIEGAIKNPGTYEIKENQTISDLIIISGGLNNNADINSINLNEQLKDGMVINIKTKDNINCEEIPVYDNKKISLNKATKEELMSLNGIGEKKANDIIEYRNKNNGFKNIEEIKEISGIGEATFNKIKNNISL